MDSINKECNPLKHEYDNCFNKWYSEQFLNGNWETENGEPCKELFTKYRQCVTVSSAFCQGPKRLERALEKFILIEDMDSRPQFELQNGIFEQIFQQFFPVNYFYCEKYFFVLKGTQLGRSCKFWGKFKLCFQKLYLKIYLKFDKNH